MILPPESWRLSTTEKCQQKVIIQSLVKLTCRNLILFKGPNRRASLLAKITYSAPSVACFFKLLWLTLPKYFSNSYLNKINQSDLLNFTGEIFFIGSCPIEIIIQVGSKFRLNWVFSKFYYWCIRTSWNEVS